MPFRDLRLVRKPGARSRTGEPAAKARAAGTAGLLFRRIEVYARRHAAAIVTTSWDDGHSTDLRVAELLAAHGLKGTFYVAFNHPNRPEIASNPRYAVRSRHRSSR